MPRPQFLIILTPSRPSFPADATPAELDTISRHFAHLQDHHRKGRVILVGEWTGSWEFWIDPQGDPVVYEGEVTRMKGTMNRVTG